MLIVAAALALGTALEATGGAAYIAMLVLRLMEGASPSAVLSALFLIVAAVTNVLTNNAAGVLFTPIAINVAAALGTDVFPFALAVVFGASCSFATPIGYQTNLLVMGPGHYRFKDFVTRGPAAGLHRMGGVLAIRALVLRGALIGIGWHPAMHLFFSTEPAPCPYLPGRLERRLVTVLEGQEPDRLHDCLLRAGFRRSQGYAYRPGCAGCHAARPSAFPWRASCSGGRGAAFCGPRRPGGERALGRPPRRSSTRCFAATSSAVTR